MNKLELPEINRLFNFRKLLLFPWGLVPFAIGWYSILLAAYIQLTDNDPLTWWGKLLIYGGGLAIYTVFLLFYNYIFIPHNKTRIQKFIFLYRPKTGGSINILLTIW